MAELRLLIANKNYSSWSLRAWLALRHCQLAFEEIRIPLGQADSEARLREWSPSGLAPCLIEGNHRIWDSLAICETLHERHPDRGLWPADPIRRAWARAVTAEMHAGFAALRRHLPMNCRRTAPPAQLDAATRADIARIVSIWNECRAAHAEEGPWLFGEFGIADCFYAPVAIRFSGYRISLEGTAAEYVHSLLHLPAMQEWITDGRAEPERLPQYELA